MKLISATAEGISPLIINRFKEQDEIPQTVTKKGGGNQDKYGTPREQAEKTPYYDEDTKKLWIPSAWITGTLVSVASDYAIAGSRKSLKSVISGAVTPTEEKIYFVQKYKLKDIEIDSRPVIINRARIMRHRAKLEKWALSFALEVDDEIITPHQLYTVLVDAGRRAGFGDYRPNKQGPFGRFIVTEWKEALLASTKHVSIPYPYESHDKDLVRVKEEDEKHSKNKKAKDESGSIVQ